MTFILGFRSTKTKKLIFTEHFLCTNFFICGLYGLICTTFGVNEETGKFSKSQQPKQLFSGYAIGFSMCEI